MNRYLFVIDYQNDFVDGALGFPGAEKLDAGIAAKVREYGKGHVLFTRDTHFENYLDTREGKNLPVKHCIKGSFGWEVYGQTAKALAEVEAPAIDKLVFGMDVTDPATAAVLQSKYPEAKVLVDASCTDSFDKSLHEKVLDVLEGFQVTVVNRTGK